ncbi:MAG: hypothetical protein U0Q22_10450 [Acidimicrobiales bacterium]
MQKRVGMVSFLALAMVLYLIWKDPHGTADMIGGFGSAVGGFFGDLWHKLGEFFTSLFGK